MDILFLTYLMVMCESIGAVIKGIAIFFTVAAGLGAFVYGMSTLVLESFKHLDTKPFMSLRRMVKIGAVVALCGHLVAALIPSQKSMAIIVGSTGAYMALTSDPAKKLGNKAFLLLEKKIDDALKSEDNGGQAKEKEESKGESSTKSGEPKSSGQVQQSGQST